MREPTTQLKLNIPLNVKAWLEEQADRNMRSQNAEVVLALKERMKSQTITQKADAQA